MKKLLDHQKDYFNKIAITYHKHSNNNLTSIKGFYKITKAFVYGNVLDIGSGGILGYETKNAKTITIADIASETLANPKKLVHGKLTSYKSKKLNTVTANVLKMPFRNSEFDTVIMVTTAHHLSVADKSKTIKNIKTSLNEINRVLKNNGTFIIHECFLNPILKFIEEIMFTISFRILSFFSKPLPYFMSEGQLSMFLKSAGFNILEIKTIHSGRSVYIPLFPYLSPPGWIWDIVQPSKTYICQKVGFKL